MVYPQQGVANNYYLYFYFNNSLMEGSGKIRVNKGDPNFDHIGLNEFIV